MRYTESWSLRSLIKESFWESREDVSDWRRVKEDLWADSYSEQLLDCACRFVVSRFSRLSHLLADMVGMEVRLL